jgi:porphobilinogen synthase
MKRLFKTTGNRMEYFIPSRPRRNRRFPSLRALLREQHLKVEDLVMPLFVLEGEKCRLEVNSMPGIFRFSVDTLVEECRRLQDDGIRAVALFPALDENRKDRRGSESLNEKGLYPRALRAVKKACPDLLLISDVALDPYSSDGHDGLVIEGRIDNDKTLPLLAEMALCQARAGADMVAPSDMMDGRVAVIREVLDEAGFMDVGILAYTAKYASAFYGPFRDALDSAPKAGDKKTYQMDPANGKEALRELNLDLAEGADIVMVKPGLPYLDVLYRLSEASDVPVAVYNVSGEYAMLRAAASRGFLDYSSSVMESLIAFKRAGADLIFSYHAGEVAGWMKKDGI